MGIKYKSEGKVNVVDLLKTPKEWQKLYDLTCECGHSKRKHLWMESYYKNKDTMWFDECWKCYQSDEKEVCERFIEDFVGIGMKIREENNEG